MTHTMTRKDIKFAVEFITLGTDSTTIFEAEDKISASQEYQDCIQEDFGMHYEELLDIIFQHFRGETVSPFAEEAA